MYGERLNVTVSLYRKIPYVVNNNHNITILHIIVCVSVKLGKRVKRCRYHARFNNIH